MNSSDPPATSSVKGLATWHSGIPCHNAFAASRSAPRRTGLGLTVRGEVDGIASTQFQSGNTIPAGVIDFDDGYVAIFLSRVGRSGAARRRLNRSRRPSAFGGRSPTVHGAGSDNGKQRGDHE